MFIRMRGIFVALRCLTHKIFIDPVTFIFICNECSYILNKQQQLRSHTRCNVDTQSLRVPYTKYTKCAHKGEATSICFIREPHVPTVPD
jgi:hypothetical protein